MKQLFALVLALILGLSLVACANTEESADTNGTTEPSAEKSEETVPTEPPVKEKKLVSAYNSKGLGNLSYMWPEFIFTFSYNQDYTGGTVNLSGPGQESVAGEFTCDEEYRIAGISITEDEVTMYIEVKYDDHDRVNFAKITLNDKGEEKLILHTEATYNEAGKTTYSYTHNPKFDQTSVNENTYTEQGLLLENVQHTKLGETEMYTKTVYTYDGTALTGLTMMDKEGNVQLSLELRTETVDGKTYYVASADGQTIRFCMNEAGNITLTEILAGDTVISRNESTYNEEGLLVRTENTVANGTTMVYEYTYDEDGNRTGTYLLRDGEETGHTYTTYITVTP